GMRIPNASCASSAEDAPSKATGLTAPFVVKGMGLAHKSEAGAVRVGLQTGEAVQDAAIAMDCESFLIEEMVQGAVIELLLAVTLDAAHGYVLTIGAGGTQTELLQDTASLVLPVTEADVTQALSTLRCAPLLDGFRGAQGIDRAALWRAVDALQAYVIAHHGRIQEVEINPLICTPNDAVAVDALIVKGELA
ncbi:acetate--CoA ligase family protein, partial [Planktotalea sp.]|uniref:acetate--CoA ligase family protein n=1 Tax=Planktotalea sp. TaxID=2029877 RepID=UPI003299CDA0